MLACQSNLVIVIITKFESTYIVTYTRLIYDYDIQVYSLYNESDLCQVKVGLTFVFLPFVIQRSNEPLLYSLYMSVCVCVCEVCIIVYVCKCVYSVCACVLVKLIIFSSLNFLSYSYTYFEKKVSKDNKINIYINGINISIILLCLACIISCLASFDQT